MGAASLPSATSENGGHPPSWPLRRLAWLELKRDETGSLRGQEFALTECSQSQGSVGCGLRTDLDGQLMGAPEGFGNVCLSKEEQ